jgi:2-C-methyl-D-erythritol 2,4-cyclodiphosphate synthase
MNRVGYGYDVHRLVEGRKLILGGVERPFEKGLAGYSDGDVLTHALIDALLGGSSLGDIGEHFPDDDPQYKGISSLLLLGRVVELLREKKFGIGNVDVVVVAEKPKLVEHKCLMREKLSGVLGIGVESINIKAKTGEGLGFAGRGEGIAVHAVVNLKKQTTDQEIKSLGSDA